MTALAQDGFTHLHLHSQYSLLDGAIRMDELMPTIRSQGMDAVAVTDHGNMYGALHFYKQAKKHGIKAIFGCEAYVAKKGRLDRSVRDSAHLVLLAKNEEGYRNLTYLISKGFTEGFYYNPRIDMELLAKHSKGLFGLSACLGGVINKCLFREGEAAAAAVAQQYQALFEKDHFFLELQSNGYKEQDIANQALMNIAELHGIPLVATADAHYLRPEDSSAHEVLMCIGQGKSLTEFRAQQHHSDLLYVRSPAEMWQALGSLCPQALENTQRIASQCQVELDLSQTYLPSYTVPEGFNRQTYLEHLATQGLKRRLKEARYNVNDSTYKARLDYELGVINGMGFAGYFLIVWDFIRYAKEQQIPVGPGRGSGAGSLIAWSLRITDLDPIPYDLLFERFLNPERISMPDFDIDFCQDRRGEVISYVSQKYGKENVGQIVTYSQLAAKSVIKDVGRVLELPFAEVNALTKLIPNLINGKKVSIEQALELEPKLRDIQKEKPIYADVIKIARSLEGLNRQTGIHAAGIVIGDKPLWNYVPVCRGKEGELVTQFAKDEVEEIGLIKFDFLGLKTLTVIANAVQVLHQGQHSDGQPLLPAAFDISDLPLDDAKVFQLIGSGDTDGVFQLESQGFKELLKRLKPDCFEDIVAAVALYRPGPLDAGMVDDYVACKHGRKEVTYPHSACEPILKNTYGVIVYQEQVMRIAVALCGFSMAEADILRKAMGKKKADVMAQMRQKFIDGARNHSQMSEKSADELFNQIEKFAGYAFNKSHSAAYAVISYQTAYLKTYYPVEFTAALLSTEMRDQDNVVRYIQSAREHQIKILPPCVNRSQKDFTVLYADEQRAILFGLGAVKGIGDSAIDVILQQRQEKPFHSLYDFCERVDLRKVNRRVLDALIKSGAMDTFQKPRHVLAAALDKALESAQSKQKDKLSGQISLFDIMLAAGAPPDKNSLEIYPPCPAWSEKDRLFKEKEALGFYITGHPLDSYQSDLQRLHLQSTIDLKNFVDKRPPVEVAMAGVVVTLKERPLKAGNGRMAFGTIEDLYGSCEILIFSKVFTEYEAIFKSEEPLLLRGFVVNEGDDEGVAPRIKLRVTSFELLSRARQQSIRKISLTLPLPNLNKDLLLGLKQLLTRHRGRTPVQLCLRKPSLFEARMHVAEELFCEASEAFLTDLSVLVGKEAIVLSQD